MIDEEKRIKLFKIYSNKSPMIILNIQSILLHLVPEVKEKKKKLTMQRNETTELVFFY